MRRRKKPWWKKIWEILPFMLFGKDEFTEIQRKIQTYIKLLESQGHKIHWPPRDTNQNDPFGFRICSDNGRAIYEADEIHIYYNPSSEGSKFDLGMVFMVSIIIGPKKKIVIINPEDVRPTENKSFNNVLLALAKNQNTSQ